MKITIKIDIKANNLKDARKKIKDILEALNNSKDVNEFELI
jgi:5-bromo-4-chloroindolyl phosphate hydrolysis protein